MIERTHPQALLVYTAISDHRRVIEIAAAHSVSVMVENLVHFAGGCSGDSANRAGTSY